MSKDSYLRYIDSPQWQTKRQAAFEHYGRVCMVCKSKHHLEVHHTTYDRLGDELMSDLLILCADCHRSIHTQFPIGSKGFRRINAAIARGRTRRLRQSVAIKEPRRTRRKASKRNPAESWTPTAEALQTARSRARERDAARIRERKELQRVKAYNPILGNYTTKHAAR